MSRRLTKKEEVDVIESYTIRLEPMVRIASRYNRTRQGIWKVLKKWGIEPQEFERIQLTCQACGKQFDRPRCQVRNRKRLFCSMDCWYAYLEAAQEGTYKQNRHGQRRAREVVSRYISLVDKNVVHHKDRNTLNNYIGNLMVFANHGDHIRWHRGQPGNEFDIQPIFDGADFHHKP